MTGPTSKAERPVLVAIDFSPSSREALRQGAVKAKTLGTKLLLMHVLHRPVTIPTDLGQLPAYDAEGEEALRQEATEHLSAFAKEQPLGLADDQLETVVDFSPSAYVAIVMRAERSGAQLVVVGHRGSVGLNRLLLGSVAQRVARSCHCPVLIARPSTASKRLLVTTDFSDAARRGVDYAAKLAQQLGLHVVLLHNLDLPSPLWSALSPLGPIPPQLDEQTEGQLEQAAQQLLKNELTRAGLSGQVLVSASSKPDEAIVRAADQIGAELIVMSSHGSSALRRIALGSVTESVLAHAHCSVLAVHNG